MERSTGSLPHGLRKAINPVEWLKAIYGSFGVKHPMGSLICIVILGMIIGGLVLGTVWRIGAYEYEKDAAKTMKVVSPPRNTSYGSQSPVMPDNSGTVNITEGPPRDTLNRASEKSKKHGGKTKKDSP